MAEILLKVVLNTITLTLCSIYFNQVISLYIQFYRPFKKMNSFVYNFHKLPILLRVSGMITALPCHWRGQKNTRFLPMPHIIIFLCHFVSGSWFGWIGLCCLTPLSTIFQLYRSSQLYWWRKPEYPEKPPTCRKSLKIFIA